MTKKTRVKESVKSSVSEETDIRLTNGTDMKTLLNAKDHTFVAALQQDNGLQLFARRTSHASREFRSLVLVVTRLCSPSLYRKFELNVIVLLEQLMRTDFAHQLRLHLRKSAINSADECRSLFSNAVHVLSRIADVFPAAACDDILRPTLSLAVRIAQNGGCQNGVKSGVNDFVHELNHLIEQKSELKWRRLTASGSDGITQAETAIALAPQDNFRHMSVTICQADVHQKVNPILYPNIVEGQYESVEHYMDVQFRLFREDFVGPMREAITQFIKQVSEHNGVVKLNGVNIYDSVRIRDVYIGRTSGIIHELHFGLRRLCNVNWKSTKRLLYGSLVCLSSDNFAHFSVAVIADGRPADLARGLVYVKFLDNNYGSIAKSFVMIESPAYYEAYAPVLMALKQINETNLPFFNHLVLASPDVKPPSYLKPSTIYKTKFWTGRVIRWAPLNAATWPSAADLKLDDSQMRALKAALTQEIAIIQGPPATGKTYVGLKVVQMLLENDCGQIQVICYTNHALDQFLEEILDFCPDGIIRIGGQSKSEVLAEFNLRNVWKYPKIVEKKIKQLEKVVKSRIRRAKEDMSKYRQFLRYEFDNKVTPEWMLIDLDVISDSHQYQLEEAMFLDDPKWNNALDIWLQAEDYRIVQFNSPHSTVHSPVKPSNLRNVTESATDDVLADEEKAKRVQDDEEEGEMDFLGLGDTQLATTNCYEDGLVKENQKLFEKMSKSRRAEIREKIRSELSKKRHMSDKKVAEVEDIWQLTVKNRWQLYRYWLSRAKEMCRVKLSQLQTYSEKQWAIFWEYKQECTIDRLRKAKIIGMTTSGAAKHRRNLQRLQPAVLVVEEAAEVMEAHVIAALNHQTKHLILIGDQQQLRPKPSVYELAEQYKLDVSLFERLIKNGLPYERLQLQHRMRPQISMLLVPNIYPDLLDHSVVENYENVAGMLSNVYFLNHKNAESNVIDSKSKSNYYEAEMLIGLCSYLLNQGYEPSQITILTGYLGQVELFVNSVAEGVRCSSIDGYQGEENDIVLLSLVRSNDRGTVGFLKVENRVCVALSRAKKGLYCIGDLQMLTAQTDVWKPITQKLADANLIGPAFSLVCQNHPETITEISAVDDFHKVSCGGCSLPCDFQLLCGHNCPLTCHILDREHQMIVCEEICFKATNCQYGHKCHKRCGEECGICESPVLKIFSCGHENVVPCNVEPTSLNCPTMAIYQLPCNHSMVAPCDVDISELLCEEIVKRLLSCGHHAKMQCCFDPDKFKCMVEMKTVLNCGHDQMVLCSVNPLTFFCQEKCQRLLKCGHETIARCSQSLDDILCMEKCGKLLRCGHLCSLRCCQACAVARCTTEIELTSSCGHRVNAPCNDRTNAEKYCKFPCVSILPCGHKCRGSCSTCCQGRIHVNCDVTCSRILLNGQKCSNACSKVCSISSCNDVVNKRRCEHVRTSTNAKCDKPCQWRCSHKVCQEKCGEWCDREACNQPCPFRLACGHSCLGYCGEPCPNLCRKCSKANYISKFVHGFQSNNAKSRFVLLEDCNHVIERKTMDLWVAKKSEEIGDLTCPKCEAVISANFRYGKAIKKAREDVAAAKLQIYAFCSNVKKSTRRIITDILKNQPNLDEIFPLLSNRLMRMACSENLNTFDIIFLSNANTCVTKMAAIRRNADEAISDLQKRLMSSQVSVDKFKKRCQMVDVIQKQLNNMEPVLLTLVARRTASDVVWLDVSRNLLRLEYMAKTIAANTEVTANDKTNDYYSQIISILKAPYSSFDLQREEKVKTLLQQLTSDGVGRQTDVKVEPMNVLSAPGFVRGRWFKCTANGHVYATDNNNNCPQCK